MTPDDVAAYRAYSVDNDEPHVVALCDALTAAWAERDHMLPETEIRPVLECENLDVLRSALIGVKRGQIHMRERAERAELFAQIAESKRAEIDADFNRVARQRDEFKAALARAQAKVEDVPDSDDYEDEFMCGVYYAKREIRIAIEGNK